MADNEIVAKELIKMAKELTSDDNGFKKAKKHINTAAKVLVEMENGINMVKKHLEDLSNGIRNKSEIKNADYLEESINTNTKRFLKEIKNAVWYF